MNGISGIRNESGLPLIAYRCIPRPGDPESPATGLYRWRGSARERPSPAPKARIIPAQANGLGANPIKYPKGCKPESSSLHAAIPRNRHREQPPLATHGEIKGDTTTLEDFQEIAKLRESEEG